MWIWFVIAGVFSGVVAGMGMGGGTLLIPILTLLLDVEQKMAQSINLLVFIPTAIVALIIHFKNKLVDIKVGITIIISGVIFSLFGAWIATNMSNMTLKKFFGVFLIVIGFMQLIESIFAYISKSKLPKNIVVKSNLNTFQIRKIEK